MLRFFSKKAKDTNDTKNKEIELPKKDLDQGLGHGLEINEINTIIDTVENPTNTKPGFFKRLTSGLKRTKENFTNKLADLVLGKKTIDSELLAEIEATLIIADVGVTTTKEIIDNLTKKLKRKDLDSPEKLLASLADELTTIITPCEQALTIQESATPFVILITGVNGAGKTTTIGKIAKKLAAQGKKVMLAAGDTFRAAAIEQLKTWGERNNIPVISQQQGSDSASVIFDAYQAAKARGFDVLIADTAGRLHTQSHLMNELQKIVKVIKKADPNAPHETMLILDASIGQNALNQAKKFHEAINISGLTITKLDGTAKGGILFAIAKELSLPIRYIGVGEQIDDLQDFEAKSFVKALFEKN